MSAMIRSITTPRLLPTFLGLASSARSFTIIKQEHEYGYTLYHTDPERVRKFGCDIICVELMRNSYDWLWDSAETPKAKIELMHGYRRDLRQYDFYRPKAYDAYIRSLFKEHIECRSINGKRGLHTYAYYCFEKWQHPDHPDYCPRASKYFEEWAQDLLLEPRPHRKFSDQEKSILEQYALLNE